MDYIIFRKIEEAQKSEDFRKRKNLNLFLKNRKISPAFHVTTDENLIEWHLAIDTRKKLSLLIEIGQLLRKLDKFKKYQKNSKKIFCTEMNEHGENIVKVG